MKLRKTSVIALGIGALAIPAAAVAAPGGHGHAHGHAHAHGSHGHNPSVMYVFKGSYEGGGVVSVNHGNAHVKKADLLGTVQFDLSATRLEVADTNTDGAVTADDVVSGDKVLVLARLPKQDPGDQPFAARQLVDQTNPADDTGDED
jgi:hypothetical protein